MSEKKLISWVRPGVLLVRAVFRLWVSALMALDLPALERPAKATSRPESGGHSLMEGALLRNCTFWKVRLFKYLSVIKQRELKIAGRMIYNPRPECRPPDLAWPF